MGENWIELKVLNCKDLKVFNFFQKPCVYALVSIVTDNNKSQYEQRTPTDSEGDANNPEWNHEMRFDLGDDYYFYDDNDKTFVQFDLRCEGLFGVGERSIGEVRVPLKDLVQGSSFNNGGIVRFVSYEIRNSDGKPNGVLNFSFKFNIKEKAPQIMMNQMIQGYPISNPNPNPNPNLYPDNWKVEYPLDPYGYEGGYQFNQGYYPPPSHHHMQWSPPPPPPPPMPYPPPPPPPNGGFGGNYDYNGGFGWFG